MRDLLLVGFLFVAAYFAFRKPFLGVAAWIWIALTAPADWVFGFSQSFRLNLTIVAVTAVSVLMFKGRKAPNGGSIAVWVMLFFFWTLISTTFNNSMDSAWVWDYWVQFSKIILLFVFILMTVRTRLHVDTIIWAIVLSISSYAGMEGVKFILSAGGHKIEGRAGIIQDRNDLAVAINMCLPLIYYLVSVTRHKILKNGLYVLLALNIVGVIGTYSRGGFIGLSILAFAFWLGSRHKLVIALAALLTLPVAYGLAPEEWRERQTTITTAAEEDGSFIGRLWAWKISTMIALDNPITGGGFGAVTEAYLWDYYAPSTPNFGPIYTPPIGPGKGPKAAHNIYFQVLGDHGFIGLAIFLAMLAVVFFSNLRNLKVGRNNGVDWYRRLAASISLGFIGYGITGANVSLAYFDLLYALLGIVAVMTVRQAELLNDKPYLAVQELLRVRRGGPARRPEFAPLRDDRGRYVEPSHERAVGEWRR